MTYRAICLGTVALVCASAGIAAETITYRYDARGRLIRSERAGAINNGVANSFGYDKANNRLTRTKTP